MEEGFRDGVLSCRRDCHPADTPSPFSRRFNSDGDARILTVSPTARRAEHPDGDLDPGSRGEPAGPAGALPVAVRQAPLPLCFHCLRGQDTVVAVCSQNVFEAKAVPLVACFPRWLKTLPLPCGRQVHRARFPRPDAVQADVRAGGAGGEGHARRGTRPHDLLCAAPVLFRSLGFEPTHGVSWVHFSLS